MVGSFVITGCVTLNVSISAWVQAGSVEQWSNDLGICSVSGGVERPRVW